MQLPVMQMQWGKWFKIGAFHLSEVSTKFAKFTKRFVINFAPRFATLHINLLLQVEVQVRQEHKEFSFVFRAKLSVLNIG